MAPNIAYAKMKVEQEVLIHQAIYDTGEDLKPNGHLTLQGITVEVTQNGLVEVDNLLHEYVEALIQHLDERFKESLPLFSLFTVFDPVLLPSPDSAAFLDYGEDEIAKNGKIYTPYSKMAAILVFFCFLANKPLLPRS